MNSGYFTSFTVFLALSNPGFCDRYVRRTLGLPQSGLPLVTLGGYVRAWGWAFAAVTVMIALFKRETERFAEPAAGGGGSSGGAAAARGKRARGGGGSGGSGAAAAAAARAAAAEVADAYRRLWGVARLRPVWALSLLLVTYRIGVLPAESAASLKLLDKGVSKEALAGLVLLQFPVELVSAVVAGR